MAELYNLFPSEHSRLHVIVGQTIRFNGISSLYIKQVTLLINGKW